MAAPALQSTSLALPPSAAGCPKITGRRRAAAQSRNFALALDLYLGALTALTLAAAAFTLQHSRSWVIADWLINYQAGFIRRGLAGELIYRAAPVLHLAPASLVLVACLVLYSVILAVARFLALRCSGRLWAIALLISPATLAFPVLEFSAGFHKEILFPAALALLLLLLAQLSPSPTALSVYLSVVFVACVLSHESLICFAPYLAAALLVGGRSLSQTLKICLIPALLGVAAATASATHLGDPRMAQQICSSLGYSFTVPEGTEICDGGAIGYLTHTSGAARSQTAALIHDEHFFIVYPLLALLALLPIFAGTIDLARRGQAPRLVQLWIAALLAFAASALLFLYSMDWGRWIYVHVLSLALLMLALDARTPAGSLQLNRTVPSRARRAGAIVLLLLYATTWSLPQMLRLGRTDFGYLGIGLHLARLTKAPPATLGLP